MGMRGAWLPALGVALLAAGFGLGIVVAGSRAPVVISNVTPAPTTPAPESPRAESAPAAPAADPSPAAALSDADREALRAILERAPAREVPSGSGVITGSVKIEDGSPLPGVEVTCTPETPRRPRPPLAPGQKPPPPDPLDAALESAAWTRWLLAARRTALTDASGAFRFEGLADAAHQVNASLADWDIRPRDPAQAQKARPGADLALIAKPSVEVRLEITREGGPLPDRMSVAWSVGEQSTEHSFQPSNPAIRVPPGSYEMTLKGGDHGELRSDPQPVEVPPPGSGGVTVKFAFRDRPGIRGRLLFAEGETWENAMSIRVLLRPLRGEEKPDAASLRASSQAARLMVRGDTPSFSFPDLTSGRYAVGIAIDHNGPVVLVEEVAVGDGLVERDLRVPSPDPTQCVVVRVLGPDGEPVPTPTFATGYRAGNSSSSGGSVVVRLADGSRKVLHHANPGAEDPEGIYWITVTTARHGQAKLEYRKGERSEWTVRMEPPGRIEARVSGLDGNRFLGRLQFVITSPTDARTGRYHSFDSREARVDGSGLQAFPSVQPGEYALVLLMSYGHTVLPVATTTVSVRSGKNEFTVPLPPLHEVTVTGAEGTATLSEPEGRRFVIWAQASEGRVVFDGVPEGEYLVNAGKKHQKFRVSGPTKVEL